jgi:hypothetical protein
MKNIKLIANSVDVQLILVDVMTALVKIKSLFETSKNNFELLKLAIEDIDRSNSILEIKGVLEDLLDDVAHNEEIYLAVANIYENIGVN